MVPNFYLLYLCLISIIVKNYVVCTHELLSYKLILITKTITIFLKLLQCVSPHIQCKDTKIYHHPLDFSSNQCLLTFFPTKILCDDYVIKLSSIIDILYFVMQLIYRNRFVFHLKIKPHNLLELLYL